MREARPSAPEETVALTLVRLVPLAVFVLWLAGACYALAYFISN